MVTNNSLFFLLQDNGTAAIEVPAAPAVPPPRLDSEATVSSTRVVFCKLFYWPHWTGLNS